MSQEFRYVSPAPDAFDVDLGEDVVRLASEQGFTESLNVGAVGSSVITLDDPAGSLELVGLKSFIVNETEAPAGNQRLYTGFIASRRYRRGDSLRQLAARKIEMDLLDVNSVLGFRVISGTDGKRPAETNGARLTWLLASGYLNSLVFDNGYVTYPSSAMDPVDYRGQRPGDVVADCALAGSTHRNFGVYYDETADQLSLWFKNSNTATDWQSSLRISNVATDVDSEEPDPLDRTTWAPTGDVVLTRNPERVVSGLYGAYKNGGLYRTRPATADTFAWRDGIAANSNWKSRAKALASLDAQLDDVSTEEDSIVVPLEIDAANVNDVKAGQLLQARFSHLSPYTGFSWFRALERTVAQDKPTDRRYSMNLLLSPANGPSSCAFDCTPSGTFYPLGGATDYFNPVPAGGIMYMCRPGLSYPFVPTPGFIGRWWFKVFGSAGGGPGTVDYAGDCTGNTLRAIVVGNGTLVVQTELYSGPTYQADVQVSRQVVAGVPTTEATFFDVVSTTPIDYGDAYTVTIDDADGDNCISIIDLNNIGTSPCNSKLGWSSAIWTSAGCGD